MRFTNENEELQWHEFKSHIEWAELFSLIILFVDDVFLVYEFRKRLIHLQKGKVSSLKIIKPQNTNALTKVFFSALVKQIIPDVKEPLWLELYERSKEWDIARDHFFSRLNEYRDQLRNQFPHPVIILVPVAYKSRLREIAPDLWSVRNYTDDFLSTPLTENPMDNVSGVYQARQVNNVQFKTDDSEELKEWYRLQEKSVTDYEMLQVGWRAFDAAFKIGDQIQSEEIAEQCLLIAKNKVKQENASVKSLRYLSVFINMQGQLENALGRREAAYELYQESLKIRQRLQEALGETPETLRDLSVSLNKVGELENMAMN